MSAICATFEVKPFVPSEEKAKLIEAEVSKGKGKQEEQKDDEQKEEPEGSSLAASNDAKEIEELKK